MTDRGSISSDAHIRLVHFGEEKVEQKDKGLSLLVNSNPHLCSSTLGSDFKKEAAIKSSQKFLFPTLAGLSFRDKRAQCRTDAQLRGAS